MAHTVAPQHNCRTLVAHDGALTHALGQAIRRREGSARCVPSQVPYEIRGKHRCLIGPQERGGNERVASRQLAEQRLGTLQDGSVKAFGDQP
jgi:hypothetical protein